jgi:hypothetical protein
MKRTVPSRYIVDASLLILLTEARHLDLLRLGGVEVAVQDTAITEMGRDGLHDPRVQAIGQGGGLPVVPTPVGSRR